MVGFHSVTLSEIFDRTQLCKLSENITEFEQSKGRVQKYLFDIDKN